MEEHNEKKFLMLDETENILRREFQKGKDEASAEELHYAIAKAALRKSGKDWEGSQEADRKTRVLLNIETILREDFQKNLEDASPDELHYAISKAVIREVAPDWKRCEESDSRKAYYLSAEYLIGRMVYSNLHALGVLKEVEDLLQSRGLDISELQCVAPPVIGNGGLGRLAACFLDSAAVQDVPLNGYGILYKYGLFYQNIENGFQVETADDWNSESNPWFIRRDDEAVTVSFRRQTVRAVPYDMPVIGYQSALVNNLRLWKAEALHEFDFQKFNSGDYNGAVREKNDAEIISYVLYPNDDNREGKILRLKQQYFFSSASLKDLLRDYGTMFRMRDMEQFVENTSIQLNDTHPVVAIPELIRLFMRGGITFEDSFEMAQEIFNYTNHTIMAEALEKWDIRLFRSLLPEVYEVIKRINKRLLKEIGDNPNKDKLEIIHDGEIHMARLAIYCSSHVNGVAKIHSDLLKNRELREWYELYPERFQNKTNGVTQRRWLALCNPQLADLISSKIGTGWIKDFSQIKKLEEYIPDDSFVEAFNKVKDVRKKILAEYIHERDRFNVDFNTVFDIQAKRMHEYKRQLLNAFSILDLYFKIKNGELQDMPPASFIFAAKAAPGYYIAKAVIKLINAIGVLVSKDEAVKGKLAVYFVSNYDVPYAEKLAPAADISEQISTAGTEASGTGNMKFMINGAVTLGTYDGANIEIFQEAGEENNYVFGARVEEIERLDKTGEYNPRKIYEENPQLHRVVDALIDGTLDDGNSGMFRSLYNALLGYDHSGAADRFKTLLDFDDYVRVKTQTLYDYRDRLAFGRKCLYNIARSGYFSSDRCIIEYANEIWDLKK